MGVMICRDIVRQDSFTTLLFYCNLSRVADPSSSLLATIARLLYKQQSIFSGANEAKHQSSKRSNRGVASQSSRDKELGDARYE